MRTTPLFRRGLALLAVLVLGLLWLSLFSRGNVPRPPEAKAFFIDTETGQESIRSAADLPPLTGASGNPTVVRAVYVTIDGGATRKLAFLQKLTDQSKAGKERVARGETVDPAEAVADYLVSRPAPNIKWVPVDSPEGAWIINSNPFGTGTPEPVSP